MFVPLTPIDFRNRAAALFSSRTAIVDGDRRFTYGEFASRTERLAAALLQGGLRAGDRVAYLAYNSYPLLEGYFGVLQAGGVLLPLNIRLAAQELAYILDDARPGFLLADAEFAPLVEQLLAGWLSAPRIVWISAVPEGWREPAYDDWLEAASGRPVPPPHIDENSVAELFYTSGTTDRPKGVMLSHRTLWIHTVCTMACLPYAGDEVVLHTIPLFHVNGWGIPQGLTAAGGKHVMLRRFDPAEALRLIEQERATRFLAVPTMLTMLMNHPDASRRDLSSLRLILVGGAPLPPALAAQAERVFGCRVFAGYGLTETSPVLTSAYRDDLETLPAEDRIARQATAGAPMVGVEVGVMDAGDVHLPWNGRDAGEIVARSNVVMSGYWNDSPGTAAVIRDGWFHTGDIGTIDPDGTVRIVDRKKDMILSGGENISSAEVEKVLFEHPAVLEVTVFGVPDERWGEVPVALLVLRDGSRATANEIVSHCRARLAGYKVPNRVEIVHSLPKGGTGKILKAQIREEYLRAEQSRIG